MKKNIKRFKYIYSIVKEYISDCRYFIKWEYNNPKNNCQAAMESRILRQTHILEKGMSLGKPKPKFGVQRAEELIDFINDFINKGFSIEKNSAVCNAICVLGAYLEFHKERGFEPDSVIEGYKKLEKYCNGINLGEYGIKKTTRMDISGDSLPEVLANRHSVRQFEQRPISQEDMEKVVKLAMRAPSACNRQSCKVYFYKDKETNQKLGQLIAGNTGFKDDAPHYLVVTSCQSSFYDSFERNQTYVDGGIFAMALVEALHYYGIGSCILQNGEFKAKNKSFKAVCKNIPENEKIILFIAVGYYPENFTYATSHRKELKDVLKIKH